MIRRLLNAAFILWLVAAGFGLCLLIALHWWPSIIMLAIGVTLLSLITFDEIRNMEPPTSTEANAPDAVQRELAEARAAADALTRWRLAEGETDGTL